MGNPWTWTDLLCAIVAQGDAEEVRVWECDAIVEAIAAYVSQRDFETTGELREELQRRPAGEVREAAFRVLRNLLAVDPVSRAWWDETVHAALGAPVTAGGEGEGAALWGAVRASDDVHAWVALGAAVTIASVLTRRTMLSDLLLLRGETAEAARAAAALRAHAIAAFVGRDPNAACAVVRAVITRGSEAREQLFDAEIST